jgi:hypothetical protein
MPQEHEESKAADADDSKVVDAVGVRDGTRRSLQLATGATSTLTCNSSGDQKMRSAANDLYDDARPLCDAPQEEASNLESVAEIGYLSMETLSTHSDLPGYVQRHRNDLSFPEKVRSEFWAFPYLTPHSLCLCS